ncbi:hypothetical protein EVAR_6036_1 [Eumeta japonica]|uniref:Uncharacterized protein n=1 Tax=Eumeta variegata TaxID=151549 RepID=A0A4C1TAN2_EUMVA|nr:hypothetical protein EVAR_6036_1 [Eumeta japonica]
MLVVFSTTYALVDENVCICLRMSLVGIKRVRYPSILSNQFAEQEFIVEEHIRGTRIRIETMTKIGIMIGVENENNIKSSILIGNRTEIDMGALNSGSRKLSDSGR